MSAIKAKFSQITGGIYPVSVYSEFPPDALDIPENLYEKYKSGEISGFSIVDGAISESISNLASKTSRINALQIEYESDRNKLNMAWLSAIIADGAQETARKAIISTQMTDLQTKLQADIAAILAEA